MQYGSLLYYHDCSALFRVLLISKYNELYHCAINSNMFLLRKEHAVGEEGKLYFA